MEEKKKQLKKKVFCWNKDDLFIQNKEKLGAFINLLYAKEIYKT